MREGRSSHARPRECCAIAAGRASCGECRYDRNGKQGRGKPSPDKPATTIYFRGRSHTIQEAGVLAIREQTLGNLRAALDIYELILTKLPDYADVYNNRGVVLHALKRYEEALADYDKAIALTPDYAEAWNNRGATLQTIKRYDEALASCDRANALKPDYAEAWNNRGLYLVNKGDMPGAETMCLKALALQPDYPDPLFNLANIRHYRDADHADIKHAKQLLQRPGISPEDREHLYFTLGEMHDDCGRYDDAFECYRQANQIRNGTVSYDADGVVAITDSMIDVFSEDFLAQPMAGASDRPSPLFIVGMPRSGTTLLAAILSNHRDIGTAGELETIVELTVRLPGLIGRDVPYPQAHSISRRPLPPVWHRIMRNA